VSTTNTGELSLERLPAPPLPITALIITLNGATHLGRVLSSVAFCHERLVIDSGSTDNTICLAEAAGARVLHQPFLGYGPQKQAGVELAIHDWILSLDDDEVLDAEAIAAIKRLDFSDPSACWSLRRRTFIGNHEIFYGPWRNDRVVRLFNRHTAAFKPLWVHEEVAYQTPPKRLPGSIQHFSYDHLSDVIARSVSYAPLKAEIMQEKGERVHLWKLPVRGLATFVRCYFLQGGWRDGARGFVIALSRVIDSTLPRAILLEAEGVKAKRRTP